MSNPVLYAYSEKDLERVVEKLMRKIQKSTIADTDISGNIMGDRLTQKEAAEFLGCSVQTIMNWKKKGIIPYYQVESSIFYLKGELLECARKNSNLRKVSRK